MTDFQPSIYKITGRFQGGKCKEINESAQNKYLGNERRRRSGAFLNIGKQLEGFHAFTDATTGFRKRTVAVNFSVGAVIMRGRIEPSRARNAEEAKFVPSLNDVNYVSMAACGRTGRC